MVKKTTGENLSSKLMRLKDSIAIPTSTVWTSPEIRPAQWLRSGIHSLSLSSKPRPQMDILSECSALLSPRRQQSKLRQPATPRHPIRNSLEKR